MSEGYPAAQQSPVDDIAAAQTAQAEATQRAAHEGTLRLGERTNCYPAERPLADRNTVRIGDEQLPTEQGRELLDMVKQAGEPDENGEYPIPGVEGITVNPKSGVEGYPWIAVHEGEQGVPGILDEERADEFIALLGPTVYAEMVCSAVARQKGLKVLGYVTEIGGKPTELTYDWAFNSGEFGRIDRNSHFRRESEDGLVEGTYTTPIGALKEGDRSLLDQIGTFVVSEDGVLSWVDHEGFIKITGSSDEGVALLEALGYSRGEWQPPFSEGEVPNDARSKEENEKWVIDGMLKRGETFTVDGWHKFLAEHPGWSSPAPHGLIKGTAA